MQMYLNLKINYDELNKLKRIYDQGVGNIDYQC